MLGLVSLTAPPTAELGGQLAIKAVRMISRVTQYSAKQF
jgi:hypothetical protein